MRYLLFSFQLFLVIAALTVASTLGLSLPAQATAPYCWCMTPSGKCENHTSTDGIPGRKVEQIVGDTVCKGYCKDRGFTYVDYQQTEQEFKEPLACQKAAKGGTSASTQGGSSAQLYNPLGNVTLQGLIGRIIRVVIGIVGALALAAFVYGGIVLMTSGGSDKRVAEGKAILINATIGVLLVLMSWTLATAIINAFSRVASSVQQTRTTSN